jgi:hypothetical protein
MVALMKTARVIASHNVARGFLSHSKMDHVLASARRSHVAITTFDNRAF